MSEIKQCGCSHTLETHGRRGCMFHVHNGGFGFCPCLITREQLETGNISDPDDDTEGYARSAYVNGY